MGGAHRTDDAVFRRSPIRLIIDVTPYEEHAPGIYLRLLQHSRVLPLTWKVMPRSEEMGAGVVGMHHELFERIAPHVGTADCTVIGDSAFGYFVMVQVIS